MSSLGGVISRIQQENDILEVGGINVDNISVIDGSGMINQERITGLQDDITALQNTITSGSFIGAADINMNEHSIKNLANPIDSNDAVNKYYIDHKFNSTDKSFASFFDNRLFPSSLYSDAGYVIVNKSTSSSIFRETDMQIHTNDYPLSVARYSNDNNPSSIIMGKSRNSTIGNITANNSGDSLSQLLFCGTNNSQFLPAARIETLADGSPSSSGVPGSLQFYTTNSSGSELPRLKIDSIGNINCLNNKIINIATPTSNTDAANKVYVDNQISGININTLSSNLNANNYKITSLATPTSNSDAATKAYVDSHTTNLSTLSTNLNAGGYKITNLGNPISNNDAINLDYYNNNCILLDSNVVGITRQIITFHHIDWNGYKIKNIGHPVDQYDAVNKDYVDTAISGLSPSSSSLTSTYIGYGNSSNQLTGDGFFTWNPTLKSLGVGGAADNARLEVGSTTNLTSMAKIGGLISPVLSSASINNLELNATINPNIAAGGTFTRAAELSILPSFDLFTNNIVTNGYGIYISSGNTNLSSYASITNGYGIYVDLPSYGTSKYAGYFNGATYINGALTAGTTTVGTLTAGTTTVGALTANSLSVGSAVLGPVTTGTISCSTISTSGVLNMNNNKITNIAIPTDLGDAATKNYVDSKIWDFKPVMTKRVPGSLANNNAGNTTNFTCQVPWYGSFISLYAVTNGTYHIQTNGSAGQYLAVDFQNAITGNGLYSVRFALQYAADRAIVNVSYKPGTYGGSYATTLLNTYDTYHLTSLGASDKQCEEFFTINNYPDITSVCIIWQVNGKNASSSNYYYVMGGIVDLYRWR